MSSIVQTLDVEVPVRVAYDQWTQFESFPEFMDGVERVVQIDDRTMEWTAEVAGQKRSWRAEITQQEPDMRIAWQSLEGEGVRQAGVVTFHRIDDQQSRVTLQMDVEPEGIAEKTADALGIIERQVEGDLKRFKAFIESRATPTGAWRGRIDQAD